MRFDMHRPPQPDLSAWIDEMDGHLASRVRPATGSIVRPPQVLDAAIRLGRSLARPIAHGGAALVAVIVVFTAMSVPRPAPTTEPAVAEAAIAEAVISEIPISDTAEPVLPSRAPDVSLLSTEDARALVASDIRSDDAGLTGAPRSTAPAVPTPDGGGSATASLRPRVR